MIGVIASRHRQQIETAFVSTWNVATNNETVTLPVSKNYEVDWGDGTTTTTGNSHTYTTSGTYQIKMYGVIDDWAFANSGDRLKILSVDNFGASFILTSGSFYGCSNMTITATDIDKVVCDQNCGNAFLSCSSLNTDLSDLDVSTVISATSMFGNMAIFNSPLPTFTSTTNSMNFFLSSSTSFNQDVSSWDFSGIKNLKGFMQGKSSANYNYQYYDNLLIKWDTQLDVPNMTNKTVDMGTIKRSLASLTAYNSLVSKSLIISDGGLI